MSTLGSTPRRARPRWIGAAFLALPVLELATIIAVGRALGTAVTLLLLAAGVVAGVSVLRRVARPLRPASGPTGGPIPGPAGGPRPGTALLVPAGLLLMVPGFLSDVAGLVLLIPAVRRVLAARLGEAVVRRVNLRVAGLGPAWAGPVIPGEVVPGATDDAGYPGPGRGEPVPVRVTEVRVVEPPALPPGRPSDPTVP